MKIVITDGYALNPGDLSWELFNELGEVMYYDRSAHEELVTRCKDANIIICNKSLISREVIREASNLKVIAVTATGIDCVDLAATKENNIIVCNVPEYGTYSVAQHTIALLLELTNHVGLHADSVKNGDWTRSKDWCYAKRPLVELYQKTMGIIGYGRIGRQTGVIAQALGMVIQYHNAHRATGNYSGIPLKQLFKTSDVVVLHCPLTKTNRQMVNNHTLGLMKPSALLINTSRGPLINETDLYDALTNKIIAGAALDVLEVEPPRSQLNLFNLPNCIVTPHNAWKSFEARQKIMNTTLTNIYSVLNGAPVNVITA